MKSAPQASVSISVSSILAPSAQGRDVECKKPARVQLPREMKRLREDVALTAQILVLLGDEGLSHHSLRVFRGVVKRFEPFSVGARRRNADSEPLEAQLLAKKFRLSTAIPPVRLRSTKDRTCSESFAPRSFLAPIYAPINASIDLSSPILKKSLITEQRPPKDVRLLVPLCI